ncbi:MAG: hypothetical protein CLLPBCKN_003876 [Chroococcidiopsis cubana SAG 39.79]|nr:hypothetical protein [Chroococcidiopsis cubana SAG 39.79]
MGLVPRAIAFCTLSCSDSLRSREKAFNPLNGAPVIKRNLTLGASAFINKIMDCSFRSRCSNALPASLIQIAGNNCQKDVQPHLNMVTIGIYPTPNFSTYKGRDS